MGRADTAREEARGIVEELWPKFMPEVTRLRAASAKGGRRQEQAASAAGPRQRPISPKRTAWTLVPKALLVLLAKQRSPGRTASPRVVLKSCPRSSRGTVCTV